MPDCYLLWGEQTMLDTRHTHELEAAITRFMADYGVDRTEAVRRILSAWFSENGYFPTTGPSLAGQTPIS
jgi:hypothetical protein